MDIVVFVIDAVSSATSIASISYGPKGFSEPVRSQSVSAKDMESSDREAGSIF